MGKALDHTSVNAIFASIQMTVGGDDRIEMTPQILQGWISALKYQCYLVLGTQALLSLSVCDWFMKCADTKDNNLGVGHFGSIFGVPILVPNSPQEFAHNLVTDCLYVISKDGQNGVSQLLLP